MPEHHRRGPRSPHDAALRSASSATRSRCYNPPIRVAEEFAMLDCICGGRLVAGFPVGTPMDTNFCYGQIPALTRDKYARGARADHEGVVRARAVRVRRQVQPAALRELLAQARSSSRTRRSTSRAAARSRRGTSASTTTTTTPTSVVRRLPRRQEAARRLLGAGGRARQGRLALPRRVRADHLRRRHRRRGREAVRRAHPLLLQPLPPRVPGLLRPGRATAPSTTIKAGVLDQFRAEMREKCSQT